MENIFSEHYGSDAEDSELVTAAQQGNRVTLEELVLRHQAWIYNIALRMVGNPHDAEDVTQEILIKIITKLSTFQGKSSFRTWVYRIVTNHVLNMQKRPQEYFFKSFHHHASLIDRSPDQDLPDPHSVPVDVNLLVEETRISCMMGMLLCLDRTQRLVLILGGILGINSAIGSEILEIRPENFRQHLSRARKQLTNYMNEKCGLMNKDNPCNCARKTRAAIAAGYVDPEHLKFHQQHVQKVKTLVTQNINQVDDVLELRAERLFQEQPFLESPDYVQLIENLLQREEFQILLNFN
jgi:RNA polymerase sigma factor (sigma-70 family)